MNQTLTIRTITPKSLINKFITWCYYKKNSWLPLYVNIPFSKYRIAVWSAIDKCPLSELRITIQTRSGIWMATIKQGDHEDEYRVSKHFRIFGFKLTKRT